MLAEDAVLDPSWLRLVPPSSVLIGGEDLQIEAQLAEADSRVHMLDSGSAVRSSSAQLDPSRDAASSAAQFHAAQ